MGVLISRDIAGDAKSLEGRLVMQYSFLRKDIGDDSRHL